MNITEAVRLHLLRFLSTPVASIASSQHVQVAGFADRESDSWWLVTMGMAGRRQSVKPPHRSRVADPRTELVMLSYKQYADTFGLVLLQLAEYPFANDGFLHWGHVVPLGRPLLDSSRLTAIYLSFPDLLGEEFATLQIDGERCDFLWVIPITSSEKELFDVDGADALEEALEQADIDVADPWRRSAI